MGDVKIKKKGGKHIKDDIFSNVEKIMKGGEK